MLLRSIPKLQSQKRFTAESGAVQLSVGRSTHEMLRVLDGLQVGGLCPGEREMGDAPINVLTELGPNRVIGHYEVVAEIGSGAFGTVFRARDQLLDRLVALKVLKSNSAVPAQSLLREARAAAALNHPNVCAVYSTESSNGAPMIVMEYVDGQPLSDRMAAGPIDNQTVADLARQIAAGMAAAHDAGVVHGDLKPANVMVTSDGLIKIMDFGLARRVNPASHHEETLAVAPSSGSGLAGTPAYMAPELARGESPTPASDVFALGLIIYEMIARHPAVSGKNILDVLKYMQQFDATGLVADLSDPFASIARQALATQAYDRQISMAQIAQRLA